MNRVRIPDIVTGDSGIVTAGSVLRDSILSRSVFSAKPSFLVMYFSIHKLPSVSPLIKNLGSEHTHPLAAVGES